MSLILFLHRLSTVPAFKSSILLQLTENIFSNVPIAFILETIALIFVILTPDSRLIYFVVYDMVEE